MKIEKEIEKAAKKYIMELQLDNSYRRDMALFIAGANFGRSLKYKNENPRRVYRFI